MPGPVRSTGLLDYRLRLVEWPRSLLASRLPAAYPRDGHGWPSAGSCCLPPRCWRCGGDRSGMVSRNQLAASFADHHGGGHGGGGGGHGNGDGWHAGGGNPSGAGWHGAGAGWHNAGAGWHGGGGNWNGGWHSGWWLASWWSRRWLGSWSRNWSWCWPWTTLGSARSGSLLQQLLLWL